MWQHPFVSVFKLCDVETWAHVSKEGNVIAVLVWIHGSRALHVALHSQLRHCQCAFAHLLRIRCPSHRKRGRPVFVQDKAIGKRVLHITGSVPAANHVLMPKLRSQSLGLTGSKFYIQVRSAATGAATDTCSACVCVR